MALLTKRIANNTRYAVIRSYQPARIERELLAQVFDLAGRGSDVLSEPGDGDLETTDIAAEGLVNVGCATSLFESKSQPPIATLKDAA